MITTHAGPQIDAEYRYRFNSGSLLLNGSLGYYQDAPQATIYAKGEFNLNDTWRWGFNIARTSSAEL